MKVDNSELGVELITKDNLFILNILLFDIQNFEDNRFMFM